MSRSRKSHCRTASWTLRKDRRHGLDAGPVSLDERLAGSSCAHDEGIHPQGGAERATPTLPLMHHVRRGYRLPGRAIALCLVFGLATGCNVVAERPLQGAIPSADRATPTSAVPPTLAPYAGPRPTFTLPSPPPTAALLPPTPALLTLAPALSGGAVSTPTAQDGPPTISLLSPGPNTRLPTAGPVALSANLTGQGADLSTARLALDGAPVDATIWKDTSRRWTAQASPWLEVGAYTAQVVVVDTRGRTAQMTWTFSIDAPLAGMRGAPTG